MGDTKTGTHQCFGHFTGTVRAGDRVVQIKKAFGWAEEHIGNWYGSGPMKNTTHEHKTEHGAQGRSTMTRRRALILLPAAAVALAAGVSLFRNRPAPPQHAPAQDIPHDTLIHGMGWCIPH